MSDSPDDTDRPEESDAADGDEFELERGYDRSELAAVFREFATAFESGRPLRLDSDDRTVRITVPERVVAEFEVEYDSDAELPVGELELELEWDDPDGSSVRVSDRDSTADDETAETAERGAETESEDVDPAAAVMPLEGVADRDGDGDDVDAAETAVTADGADDATADQAADSGRTSRFEVYEDKGGNGAGGSSTGMGISSPTAARGTARDRTPNERPGA